MVAIPRLKRRAEFLKAASAGRRWATPGLVLQVLRHPDGKAGEKAESPEIVPPLRVGFTASRKVGIAVARNRAKRRLRAAVDAVMPDHAAVHHDYVLIARAGTLTRPFPALIEDLTSALRRLGVYRENGSPAQPAS